MLMTDDGGANADDRDRLMDRCLALRTRRFGGRCAPQLQQALLEFVL
jgi:hypothetical protein